jgi:hypothetical protein
LNIQALNYFVSHTIAWLSLYRISGICAFGYFICGLLCFDRFTARAFLSNKDPRITTSIISPNTESVNENSYNISLANENSGRLTCNDGSIAVASGPTDDGNYKQNGISV